MEAEEISHNMPRVIELGRHRIWPRLLPHIQAVTSYSRGVLGCPEEVEGARRVPFSEYVVKDALCFERSTWFQCPLLYPDISDMVAPISCSLTKHISKPSPCFPIPLSLSRNADSDGCGGSCPWFQHLRGWGRRITTSLKPSWATEWDFISNKQTNVDSFFHTHSFTFISASLNLTSQVQLFRTARGSAFQGEHNQAILNLFLLKSLLSCLGDYHGPIRLPSCWQGSSPVLSTWKLDSAALCS